MAILRMLCYNGSLVTWTVVSLTTAKFKPLIFYMSTFALSYTVNMFILMILYYFCLLPAQFYYIIVYIHKVESRVHLGKFPMMRRTLRYSLGADHTENTASNSTSTVARGTLPSNGRFLVSRSLPSKGSIHHSINVSFVRTFNPTRI
jgi:hypothetical protein